MALLKHEPGVAEKDREGDHIVELYTLRCHQTWLAGKWTIEIGDFPSWGPPFSSGIFQPAMFDDTKGQRFTALPMQQLLEGRGPWYLGARSLNGDVS